MAEKERLDQLLVKQAHFPSREQAKAAIMAGMVMVNGEKEEKAGTLVPVDAHLRVQRPAHPYVSRGGLKLERAIESFQLSIAGRIMLDVGASTGGFTDCALQHGASRVYAVDVGYGQLAWSLRTDPRVVVMERTNFRHLKPEDLPQPWPDLVTIDVSFISLRHIFPVLPGILQPPGDVVALVKPQFEAGRARVGKNGVVKDPSVHRDVLQQITSFAVAQGFVCCNLVPSPIKGGEGNTEFLLHLSTKKQQLSGMEMSGEVLQQAIVNAVRNAHKELGSKSVQTEEMKE